MDEKPARTEAEALVTRVIERAPLSEDEARRALEVAIDLLSAASLPPLRRALADALPPPFDARVRAASPPRKERAPTLDELRRQMAAGRGIPLQRAVEELDAVGSAIGSCIDEGVRALARAELGHRIAELLVPRPSPRTPTRPPRVSADERTLAAGRPGAERSIAETPLPVAHSGSVDYPDGHPDRLASAEPAGETIAEGRTGSRHPVSEG